MNWAMLVFYFWNWTKNSTNTSHHEILLHPSEHDVDDREENKRVMLLKLGTLRDVTSCEIFF
jgi:hypothetical protein